MTAHRAWRLRMTDAISGDVHSLVELIFATTVSGSQAATGGTSIASASLGGWDKSQAFDGNTGTGWASPTASYTGDWLGYDWGASSGSWVDIVEVRIQARNDAWYYQTTTAGIIEWSDDLSTWTPVGVGYSFGAWTIGLTRSVLTADTRGAVYFSNPTNFNFTTTDGLTVSSSGVATVAYNKWITGPVYWETLVTTVTGTVSIGFINRPFVGGAVMGATTSSLAYRSNGAVVLNNVTLSTISTYTSGDRISVAMNTNGLIWFKVYAGNWNNNGSADPVTNVGGIDFGTTYQGGAMYPAVGASASGAVLSGFPVSASFTYTPPTGYVDITSLQSPGVSYREYPANTGTLPSSSQVSSFPPTQLIRKTIYSPAGTPTYVSGTVEEAGVPVVGKRVMVYDKITGELLGTTFSDGSGLFSLHALGRSQVFVLAEDPGYNIAVYDQVIPV